MDAISRSHKALAVFLEVVAEYLASSAGTPPRGLAEAIAGLDYQQIALAAIAPLYNAAACNWRDEELTRLHIYLTIGNSLNRRLAMLKMLPDRAAIILSNPNTKKGKARKRRAMQYLQPEWPPEECCRVGKWLFGAAFQSGLFDFDEDGTFIIARQHQPRMREIAEDLTWRDPVILPFEAPPPDWTGFDVQYSNRLGSRFVRCWRPQTRKAIGTSFSEGGAFVSQHVSAVNRLQRVPLRIDPLILDLVRRFAGDVLSKSPSEIERMLASDDKRIQELGRKAKAQREANDTLVANDVATASFFKTNLYLGYNCDRRGRVYALSDLNYMRQDHVRALFRFANGEPIGDALNWLEIHCANCWGEDKSSWNERTKWVNANKTMIEAIEANPYATFDKWRKAEHPFQFVSACVELVNARRKPTNFITTLPIGSDGSCNGLQHLAMIMRDEKTAKHVNLLATDAPADIYRVIVKKVETTLRASKKPEARWWCKVFADLRQNDREGIIRKLIKTPAMAYAYAITTGEMARKIEKVYEKEIKFDTALTWERLLFLAQAVREQCEKELKKPTAAMKYMQRIAAECSKRKDFVQWISPTGMPICNRYQKPKTKEVYLGSDEYITVAVDVKTELRTKKASNSAAANLVHSMDASHLVRVVNEASEMDILPVHDCFACLAPNVTRLGQILRAQMALLYLAYGWPLAILANSNSVTAKLPKLGTYDPLEVQNAEYAFA